MRLRQIALIISTGLFYGGLCVAPQSSWAGAAAGGKATTTTKASTQLKKDWKLDDLKLTKKAVQEAKFPQDIRKSAIEAIDSYLSQQEKLLTEADRAKDNGAAAKKSRTALETDFQKKMKAIYGNPEYKADLEKRIKALKSEMDDDAAKAEKMFEGLNTPKTTTQPSKPQAKTNPAK